MNNLFSYAFIFITIVAIIVVLFSFGSIGSYDDFGINIDDILINAKGFTWPLPNRYYISSYYGYRNLSLYGSGPFHSGIDIPAPEGTYFLATMSGTITYVGFSGSGGYTIILEQDNLKMSYCHVHPNFLVKSGDYVEQSQVIGQVGPLHVYDVVNNPYKDKNGLPTNGSTTGCHLHLGVKVNGKSFNPMDFIEFSAY